MAVVTQSMEARTHTSRRTWWEHVATTLAIIYVAFVLLYRLGEYPSPWFDEGSYLKVAKNLAVNGIYADYSSEGNRYTGAVIAAGPTLILPVAAAFKLFGVSIPLARVIVVVYALLALLALWVLCTSLQDRRMAVIAVAVMIVAPNLRFQYFARSALGEIPGLFFMLAALALWLGSERPQLGRLIVVGLLFGLAGITKNQYGVIIFTSMAVACALDLLWYRRRGLRYFVVPALVGGAIFLAWTYYVLFMLGAGERNVSEDLAILRTTTSNTFFLLSPSRNWLNFRYLIDTPLFTILFFPALIYGFVLSLPRNDYGQRWSVLLTLLVVSILMFIFSNGWFRYEFPFMALSVPFVAGLFHKLTGGAHVDWRGLGASLRGKEMALSTAITILAVGFLMQLFLLPAFGRLAAALREGNDDLYRLSSYLRENVPESNIIETWEPEVAVLTDHVYHFPPHEVVIKANIAESSDENAPAYDFREYVDAQYVIIADGNQDVYTPKRLVDYEKVQQFGIYLVYRKRP